MNSNKKLTILMLALFLLTTFSLAQPRQSVVPNLIGLNVPQADAALHLVGLRLGVQTLDLSTSVETDQLGTISAQSVDANETLTPGAPVNITVVRAPNIRFIYDDNDLTLINQTGEAIALASLSLVGEAGAATLILAGERWGIRHIPPDGCIQIWSIGRAAPKAVAGCPEISAWFSSSDVSTYVWTQAAQVDSFTLMQAGIALTTCQAAPPASQDSPTVCDAYLPSTPPPEQVGFLYLAYTYEAFSALNPTDDAWMPLSAPLTHADGTVMSLAALFNYTNTEMVAISLDGESLTPLAPQECILFRVPDSPDSPAPEPCGLVVADAVLDSVFWRSDFTVTDPKGVKRTCAAATEENLTVCVMQQ